MPQRYDLGSMGSYETTPQGGLKIKAYPTRSGVFPYRMPDGSTRLEYRPPEEVFKPESMATIGAAPITDLHPEVDGIRIPVGPANWATLAKGTVDRDISREDTHMLVSLLVQDARMITQVISGERHECSCGYDCLIDPTPGISPEGENYDVIQRNMVYNHVALGPRGWGRAGPTVALRADSGDAEQVSPAKDAPMDEEIEGIKYKVGSAEHIAALKAQSARASGRADAADRALATARAAAPDPKVIHKAAAERARVLAILIRSTPAGQRFDEKAAEPMTMDQLVLQAIKILDPNADVEGKDPAYLAGVLDTLARSIKEKAGEAPGTPPVEDAAKTPTTPAPAAPPAAPGQVTPQKTDGGSPLFVARQGVSPPTLTTTDSEEAKEEAMRYDSDLAEAAYKKRQAARGTGKLAITANTGKA